MVFKTFSAKQMAVLCWWCKGSAHGGHDAIICDGAVRSGKTICMSLSFIAWAFYTFEDTSFAVCGKTIASLRRNVVVPLLPALRAIGFECAEKRSQHLLEISRNGRKNRFYLFGGKDEGSAALIQGMTLGGVLLDEVALMPRSFVEQALARCSLDGSKLWFNCNPENPLHWFHEEWIKKAQQKNCLYLHFTMDDNPSLTERIIQRYKSLYSGAFYERFVEGKWVAAQGLVYPMFKEAAHVREPPDGAPTKHYISCDYGTVNPSSFGLWGLFGTRWYRVAEYYHDSRSTGEQRTDEEHYAALEELAGETAIEAVVVDPSAASFMACIRRHGKFKAVPAKNEVLDGIRRVSDALKERKIIICPNCTDSVREFGLYRWDDNTAKDSPRKEHDHAMDDIRYFVSTVMVADDSFFVFSLSRGEQSG
ncbi:MAG: PBSX family phage terminase large subunit [Clostridiales bacterium]|nr:PBSX family phage terminase large subunit [Clostridiales bacterium]